MSLWWTRREQLDSRQLELIERLSLRSKNLVLGPPGSGKTNVLLRRAQYVRSQSMPNVVVLAFTRSLVEFIKTGCFDDQGREIFPQSCVKTLMSWIRELYRFHGVALPQRNALTLMQWRAVIAREALGFSAQRRMPLFDALFVDEAQDLVAEEVQLLSRWSEVLFFVGDDRQRIYEGANGLEAVRQLVPSPNEHRLSFHYRVAPEICQMADRILVPVGGDGMSATSHYSGPRPGRIDVEGPRSRDDQLQLITEKLRDQVRAYADLIRQGDRLGVFVARTADRDVVFAHLENDDQLSGKSQIIRARSTDADDSDYSPEFNPQTPICILTVKGCKGLEFRAIHWLFSEELAHYHTAEHYYTVVTRAKTSLAIFFETQLPEILARAHAPRTESLWGTA